MEGCSLSSPFPTQTGVKNEKGILPWLSKNKKQIFGYLSKKISFWALGECTEQRLKDEKLPDFC
jgi:hypothetical protein